MHANGNLRSPSVTTWRGKPGENICGINCVAELNKNAKPITAPHVVSITPQSMFVVADENSMKELKRQHQALKTALVVTL